MLSVCLKLKILSDFAHQRLAKFRSVVVRRKLLPAVFGVFPCFVAASLADEHLTVFREEFF